ncbi:hypothetical protein [Georgenia alba]|uniref:DUF1853 family protein n=1 Tax=Georgenia alba TaxID=2233858 RepID=A0ABW2Q9B9_9MICO
MAVERSPVFDDSERDDRRPGRHAEGTFTFLNRVAGDYWEHARCLIQEWADHIAEPAAYRDLRSRLRSDHDGEFRSAFLELYLHESLIRAGFDVTFHPMVAGSDRQPDFYAERRDVCFYLEATVPGASKAAIGAQRRRADALDVIDALADPNFYLSLERLEVGPKPLPAAKMRRKVMSWLRGLDPDRHGDGIRGPYFDWHDEGWVVRFGAIAVRPERRGARPGHRAIGLYADAEAQWIDDAGTIRTALGKKHRVYGVPDAPFIIAVGIYTSDHDRWGSANALYGRDGVEIQWTSSGQVVTRPARQPDGYFGAPPDWKCQHVSAVLLVDQLMPWYVGRADAALWKHPAPTYPLGETRLPVTTLATEGSKVVEHPPVISPSQFFGLPDPWPPGEPWPKE